MPDPSTRRVAIAILHYLRDHPTAKDTAEGIAKWWVSEDRGAVENALALLVKEGVVAREGDRYRLASTSDPRKAIGKAMQKLLKR